MIILAVFFSLVACVLNYNYFSVGAATSTSTVNYKRAKFPQKEMLNADLCRLRWFSQWGLCSSKISGKAYPTFLFEWRIRGDFAEEGPLRGAIWRGYLRLSFAGDLWAVPADERELSIFSKGNDLCILAINWNSQAPPGDWQPCPVGMWHPRVHLLKCHFLQGSWALRLAGIYILRSCL